MSGTSSATTTDPTCICNLPSAAVPIVTPDGYATQPYARWMQVIQHRTGDLTGVNSTTVQATATANTAAATTAQQAANQAQTTATNAQNAVTAETTARTAADLLLLPLDGSRAMTAPLRQHVYTVGTLPAGAAGYRAFVSDALAPAFGVAVTGGGAVGVPVYHDGAGWKAG